MFIAYSCTQHASYRVTQRRNMSLLSFILNVLRNKINCVKLTEKILKFKVLNDYCYKRNDVPFLATKLHRYSPIPRATAPQYDVFVTGIMRQTTEWKRVSEKSQWLLISIINFSLIQYRYFCLFHSYCFLNCCNCMVHTVLLHFLLHK